MSHYITIDEARELKKHYENFPVATLLFPKKIRSAATILYQFARQCDVIADEGEKTKKTRHKLLKKYSDEIINLQDKFIRRSPLFEDIKKVVDEYDLNVNLLERFMQAFKQDVNKVRYQNINELNDYCQKAANPAGEIILTLFGANNNTNIYYSNSLCTALAMIGMAQDIVEDYAKGRVYLPQDEIKEFRLKMNDIQHKNFNAYWISYKYFWVARIERLLNDGRQLEFELHGRIRLQIRVLIKAIELLIKRINAKNCNLFIAPPKLSKLDWVYLSIKSLLPL